MKQEKINITELIKWELSFEVLLIVFFLLKLGKLYFLKISNKILKLKKNKEKKIIF